jgi:hypothetical protein
MMSLLDRLIMKRPNLSEFSAMTLAAYALAGSLPSVAAVQIPDAQDQLDKAVDGPDLLGGKYENTFDIWASEREQFDNNIFRLPSGVDVTAVVRPSASRSDVISSPAGGIDGQWGFGRQMVSVQVSAQDNLFAKNSFLNNISSSDKIDWNWGLGGVLSGQLGIQYLQGLAGFENATTFVRNVYDQTNYFAGIRYQMGPRVTLYAGIEESIFGLNQDATKGNDSRSKSVDLGAQLLTDVDNSFGLEYRYTDARFPNSIAVGASIFDPDYREDRLRFVVKRALSEKTSIDLNAGYLKRDYANSVIGSFSGATWRGSLGWQPTDKTQVILATWRNLQAYLTDQTNYYQSTGGSISPVWTPSEKVSVSFSVGREDQRYIGSSAIVLTEIARRDTVNTAQAGMSYQATRSLTFDVYYHREQRDSNQTERAFQDGLANAHVRFVF